MAELPTTFGKYFLTERVATGGMAEIYLAKLIGPGGFEKQLIIKQILPRFSGQRQFVELFVAEAKTLVGLSHGNIVPIYELGVVDDTYFIAMEFIDGPTLEALLRALQRRQETMDPPMAAYVMAEVLKGLDYAHRKAEGVVHRDLSPRNVMLSREGEVKLVDFGLAVTVAGKQSTSGAGGRPVGSFPYMSPEQVRREKLDARSDLFSAGVLLWEMVAGRPLFARESEDATLEAVIGAEIPRPSEVEPGAPPALDEICGRALSRALDRRYQSAGEFLAEVNRVLYSLEPPVTPEDLSRLLARTCPPTPVERAAARDAGRDDEEPEQEAPGDRTSPMEGRGGQRASTVRTFATNAQFEEVLANATPLFPLRAITDEEAEAATGRRLARAEAEEALSSEPGSRPRAGAPRLLLAGGAALGAVALAGAVFAWRTGRDERAARAPAREAAPRIGPAREGDAAATASPSQLADAGAPPRADLDAAAPLAPPDARRGRAVSSTERVDSRPHGVGTLRVGANPWADVYLGERKLGQAPGSFEIPAGKHRLTLRYKDRTKTIEVRIEDGQTESVGVVDFTGP